MLIDIQSDPINFQCNACGKCCGHIRGMIPKEDESFLSEFVFGKLPVVQVVPISQMTFPLWDFEAKRFKVWQKEVNIDSRIKPLRVIYDLNSNTTIVLTYFMDSQNDACPMLEDKKCAIYHTKRAYVCRLFPFNRSPFTEKNKDEIFGSCGAMEKIIPNLPKEEKGIISFLKSAFPNGEFLNAVQNDLIIEWSNKIIVDLIKKKIIKPAVNYPYGFLLKRIGNSRQVDFTDFLVECKYLSSEEMSKIIERFDSNSDALEKIEDYSK